MATQPAPSDTLWISNLPEDMDGAMLEAVFQQCGTIVQCKMLGNFHWLFSSCRLVRFASVEHAAWICENLPGTVPHSLVGAIRVRYADSYTSRWLNIAGPEMLQSGPHVQIAYNRAHAMCLALNA